MFGEMNVTPIVDLCHSPDKVSASVNEAISRLLEVTDYPNIAKWVQLPKALFVLLVVAGDPESGAFYVYDRDSRFWLWLDFDDEKFGGYTVSDFDTLVHECRFLDIVEQPHVLPSKERWTIEPGKRPFKNSTLANLPQRSA